MPIADSALTAKLLEIRKRQRGEAGPPGASDIPSQPKQRRSIFEIRAAADALMPEGKSKGVPLQLLSPQPAQVATLAAVPAAVSPLQIAPPWAMSP